MADTTLGRLEDFLVELQRFLDIWDSNKFSSDEKLLENILEDCEEALQVTADFHSMFSNAINSTVSDQQIELKLGELLGVIESYWDVYKHRLEWMDIHRWDGLVEKKTETNTVHGVGRPKLDISEEQVISLKLLSMSWTKIAQLLGVSTKTIQRRRLSFEKDQPTHTLVNENDIDELVKYIISMNANAGEKMILGALLSRGYRIQRQRLRSSLRKVAPGRSSLNKRRIYRRTYNVIFPNALW